MDNAVFTTFMPVYLSGIGYGEAKIGILLSMGPFIAIFGQPLWGMATDRSKTKNTMLALLLLGSAAMMALYPLSKSFIYITVITGTFTFFQTSINPISDAITLEYLDADTRKFGPIRMAGTIGYAIMSVIAGAAAKNNIMNIFLLYMVITLAAFAAIFKLPGVEGHQTKRNRVSIWKVLKNREVVVLMCFSMIIQATIGFYSSFFPIYFKQLGADNGMLGWAMFLSASSEIPFLLFADRILKKLGIYLTMTLSAAAAGVRWMLLSSITNPYVILPLQLMHGLTFIVFSYSMSTYINKNVPKELKASGQALNGLVNLGVARILGSLFGGFISNSTGIRKLFFYNSGIVFISVIIFGLLFIALKNKNQVMEQKN